VLKIEGKRITFEVAIVLEPRSPEELKKLFDGHQELEAALIFNKSRVTVERFLTDEDVVTADGLVVRWNENSCVFLYVRLTEI
jgi:phosphatidate phosphatase LPIN